MLNLKTKHLRPAPPFFPGSTSLPISSNSSPGVAQGDTEWGLWSVHHLSLLLLPPQGEGLLTLCPSPAWGPSHVIQSSMNCSSVSPCLRLQFFTNCSSVGPFHEGAVLQEQTTPAWVPHGVTSPARKHTPMWAPLPTGPQVLPGTCSSTGFPWGHSLLWVHPSALVWGLPQAAGGYLLHSGHSWAAWGQPTSPWSSPQTAGESLLRCLEHLPPLLLPWPWCLQHCFSHIFSLFYLSTGFCLLCYHGVTTTIAAQLGLA